METRYLSISDAAALTGYAKSTIYHAVELGEIDAVRQSPHKLRVFEPSLRDWCQKDRKGPYRKA